MVWTSSSAVSGNGLGARWSRSRPTWIPDPAKPSTPWVEEVTTTTFSASARPTRAASVNSASPCGPAWGLR